MAHFTYKPVENPMQFIFKAVIFGISVSGTVAGTVLTNDLISLNLTCSISIAVGLFVCLHHVFANFNNWHNILQAQQHRFFREKAPCC